MLLWSRVFGMDAVVLLVWLLTLDVGWQVPVPSLGQVASPGDVHALLGPALVRRGTHRYFQLTGPLFDCLPWT